LRFVWKKETLDRLLRCVRGLTSDADGTIETSHVTTEFDYSENTLGHLNVAEYEAKHMEILDIYASAAMHS
jgi:hypothetical protein